MAPASSSRFILPQCVLSSNFSTKNKDEETRTYKTVVWITSLCLNTSQSHSLSFDCGFSSHYFRCLLRSSVYCFWKNLVLQIIYYFTLHWTICHFADEAPLKFTVTDAVIQYFSWTQEKKVLNKYISKKYSWWEMCLLSTQQQELLAPFYDNMDCSLDSGFMKWMFDTTFPYCYPKLFFNFSYWPSDQVFDWFII